MRALVLLLAASVSDDALRAGLIALQRGDLSAAQANLEAASRETPSDGRVWVALSQAYWRLHREADAEAAANKAVAVAPEDPTVLQGLAIYYSETGRMLPAARAEARLSSKLPGDRSAREKAAELYFAAARPMLDGQKFGSGAGAGGGGGAGEGRRAARVGSGSGVLRLAALRRSGGRVSPDD